MWTGLVRTVTERTKIPWIEAMAAEIVMTHLSWLAYRAVGAVSSEVLRAEFLGGSQRTG